MDYLLAAQPHTLALIFPMATINAKKLVELTNLQDKTDFLTQGISENDAPFEGDIIFSLGLLDWLVDPELEALIARGKNLEFLHAIAEKRVSLSQYLHRLYVHLAMVIAPKGISRATSVLKNCPKWLNKWELNSRVSIVIMD